MSCRGVVYGPDEEQYLSIGLTLGMWPSSFKFSKMRVFAQVQCSVRKMRFQYSRSPAFEGSADSALLTFRVI